MTHFLLLSPPLPHTHTLLDTVPPQQMLQSTMKFSTLFIAFSAAPALATVHCNSLRTKADLFDDARRLCSHSGGSSSKSNKKMGNVGIIYNYQNYCFVKLEKPENRIPTTEASDQLPFLGIVGNLDVNSGSTGVKLDDGMATFRVECWDGDDPEFYFSCPGFNQEADVSIDFCEYDETLLPSPPTEATDCMDDDIDVYKSFGTLEIEVSGGDTTAVQVTVSCSESEM